MTGQTQKRTDIITNPYLEIQYQGQMLRLELTKTKHLLGRDPHKADLLVPQTWQTISSSQLTLTQRGEDYCICDGDGNKPSTNGTFLLPDYTLIPTNKSYLLQHGMELRIGQDVRNPVRLIYFNPSSPAAGIASLPAISLKNRSVTLGRDRQATLQLNSPIVSRLHATVDASAPGQYVLTDRSTNGIFVNSQRVKHSVLLKEGDTIRIGPFTLAYRADELIIVNPGYAIRLDAYDLIREISENNRARRLLNNISLAIEPGQLVALVGGSGAGKSTLMRTLLGIDPVNHGAVFANGENLRNHFDCYAASIGYVPQDDVVHGELTVAEALRFAIKLRLPPDTNVEQTLTKTLEEVEMSNYREKTIKSLSGGQRKRVSIAVELLADPKLFFLDEPTSGLDPGLDLEMMKLLKNLAAKGRTVILVTHATANVGLCDRLVFLGRNGFLCYFGPPTDATSFFGVQDFAEIYRQLEQPNAVEHWADRYRQSTYYQRYIESQHKVQILAPQASTSKPPQPVRPSLIRQLSLLTQRYFLLTKRDPTSVVLGLLTAAICPLLLAGIKETEPFVLGSKDDPALAFLALRILFVFTSAAIWVGLSSSLQEIVKESAVYMRERLVNLGLLPYIGSKFLVLGGLALLQTVLMVAVILWGFEQPTPEQISWSVGMGITTFLSLLASMGLGLMVSAFVRNSSQANSALPLLLVPQIIFSGVLFKLDSLFEIGKIARYISWLTISRWSVGAYGSLVNVNAMVPKPVVLPDGSLLPQIFEKSIVYEPTWKNLALNWGVLGVHIAIYLTATFFQQKRKDIFK